MAVAVVLSVLGGACAGGAASGEPATAPSSVPRDQVRPVEGGSITYGIEGETVGGWCLPQAQLAAGGTEVAQAIYDTLTVPDSKGEYVPYLARTIDHNADSTQWTITLRDGISFHDGEPFNADAVVQNLDAYREGPLFGPVFGDIADVQKVANLTVKVVTRVPWIAFPAFLWGTGRLGMAAPAQLADLGTCGRNLIGTGPFMLKEWTPNDKLVVVKNTGYWQQDRFGNRLPYLDQITFRPQEDTLQRVNGLKGGDLDLVHLTDGQQITGLRRNAKAGTVGLLETSRAAEVSHTMLNAGRPPFDDQSCRLAVAFATNTADLNQLNDEVTPAATQPFAPGTIGYQKNPGFPQYDPDQAKQFLRRCLRELGLSELRFSLDSTPDPPTQTVAEALKSQMANVGIVLDIRPPTEQSQYIDIAVRGDYDAMLWRNFPGGDPDTLYVWWHSTVVDPDTGAAVANPVNFGRINDPVIDRDLDRGRSETSQSRRKALYQDIGREFAKQAYNVWSWYEEWAFAAQPAVHGLEGPALPTGQSRGVPITSVEPLLGIWLAQ